MEQGNYTMRKGNCGIELVFKFSIDMRSGPSYNEFQENFRYAKLDISELKQRILNDNSQGLTTVIELTHCDEMDRVSEFGKEFSLVRTYDTPLI